MQFADRHSAGERLAKALRKLRLRPPLLVLALPRGGLPVAEPIALALQAELDVLVVRKIGMPGEPEFAVGAIAAGVLYESPMLRTGEFHADIQAVIERERIELERRERLYRAGRPPLAMRSKAVILVDDGLATGATMLAAVRSARAAGARRLIVAVPVASPDAVVRLEQEADRVVVLAAPEDFRAVGQYYDAFPQLEDAEVCRILERHGKDSPAAA